MQSEPSVYCLKHTLEHTFRSQVGAVYSAWCYPVESPKTGKDWWKKYQARHLMPVFLEITTFKFQHQLFIYCLFAGNILTFKHLNQHFQIIGILTACQERKRTSKLSRFVISLLNCNMTSKLTWNRESSSRNTRE